MRRGFVSVAEIVALGVLAAAALWSACSRARKAPNIVMVVLDTARRDYTGVAGDSAASATPVLDALGREGTTFTNAWANAPWTVPSHASIFSGLLPSSHRCTGRHFRFESPSPTMAELLDGAGYQTVAFYSNPWLTDHLTGIMRGFQVQFAENGGDAQILARSNQGGGLTVQNIKEWLDARDSARPFLMFVNFLEPHLPYDPPDWYRRDHLSDLPLDAAVSVEWAMSFNAGLVDSSTVDWETVRRLYAGDVAAADAYLGEVLDLLRSHGLYDDAVIIVTADHGENLGDHHYMDHQFGVFSNLIDVPLVIRAPGRLAPGLRDDPAMLTDLYDTVLDLAHVTGGPETPHARSLLGGPANADRPLIAEYTGANDLLVRHLVDLNPDIDVERIRASFSKVRVDSLELTMSSDGAERLFNLARDPERRDNLADDRQDLIGTLTELMPLVSFSPETPHEIDEQLRESLRALGYIE
jgi:arylsulfatase A-like enzyme